MLSSSLVVLVLVFEDGVGVRIGEMGLRDVFGEGEGNVRSRCWESVVDVWAGRWGFEGPAEAPR